jgi:flavorubredoxin
MFDDLIPLPDGTTYNSYLVRGADKTALIDTVEPAFADVLLARLEGLGITRLDYVVSNHAEQDHSGSIPAVLKRFPDAKVVATPKGKSMLADLLGIAEDLFVPVEDGATLALGGKTLKLIHFPWVHWPETMLSYVEEGRLLFTGDLFGAHLAVGEILAGDERATVDAAKRYYAEIMMRRRSPPRTATPWTAPSSKPPRRPLRRGRPGPCSPGSSRRTRPRSGPRSRRRWPSAS